MDDGSTKALSASEIAGYKFKGVGVYLYIFVVFFLLNPTIDTLLVL